MSGRRWVIADAHHDVAHDATYVPRINWKAEFDKVWVARPVGHRCRTRYGGA